ncbi:MAG TPA: hypothetical protein VFV50_14620 [Bdellovibrionales bacterium]|nr:hypothetical protein [Bdellovibrionales bacterium]
MKSPNPSRIMLALALASSLALTACGGSSGGGSSNPPDEKVTPGEDTNTNNQLYGTWEANPQYSQGIQFTLRMRFEKGLMTVSNTCSSGGQEVTASKVVSARITSSTITVGTSSKVEKKVNVNGNELKCSLQVTGGTFRWEATGDSLLVSMNTQSQRLRRIERSPYPDESASSRPVPRPAPSENGGTSGGGTGSSSNSAGDVYADLGSTDPDVDPRLFGDWKLPSQTVQGITLDPTITISKGKVTASVRCSRDGNKATARASGAARISRDRIEVVAGEKITQVDGALTCYATVEKKTIEYRVISDSQLELSGDGQTLVLNRAD